MTRQTLERPPLATAICIYELVGVFFVLCAMALASLARSMRPELAHIPTPLFTTIATVLNLALAISGAIALWLMRREAFFVFALKFVLGIAVFVHGVVHPAALSTSSGNRVVTLGHPTANPSFNVDPPPRPRVNLAHPNSGQSLSVQPTSPPSVTLGSPSNPRPRRPVANIVGVIRLLSRAISIVFLLIGAGIAAYTYKILFHPTEPTNELTPTPLSSWPTPP